MVTLRDRHQWDAVQAEYTEEQVGYVLRFIGIEIANDTNKDFLVYCPFHGNKNTPSMTVGKTNGMFLCHNGACNESGTFEDLIKRVKRLNPFQVKRLIDKAETEGQVPYEEKLARMLAPQPDFTEWEFAARMPQMQEDFWKSRKALDYMHSRGFSDGTLKRFGIGYSEKRNLLAVPMHNEKGLLVGVIGRTASATDKVFRNSNGLPTSKTLWNIHRAKRSGSDSVIVVEASFDGMMVDQAGYPNVVACLGGHFNDYHAEQLSKYFNSVIIMTDFDDKMKHRYANCRFCKTKRIDQCKGHNPGRQLGKNIETKMTSRFKTVYWASYEDGLVYPHGAKDAGDLTIPEIRQTIANRVTATEYQSWDLS